MKTTNTSPEKEVEASQETTKIIEKNKSAQIKKILFIVIGVLLLFLIILIFVFIFNDEPTKEEQRIEAKQENVVANENTQTDQTEVIPQEPEIKEFKFDFNNLDSEKLNEQLALLTNKNMERAKEDEQKELEDEKKLSAVFNIVNNHNNQADKAETSEEKKNIEQKEVSPKENIKDEQKELKDEKKDNEVNKVKVEEQKTEINSTTLETQKEEVEEKTTNSSFLKLINIAKIKGDLNKKYFDKAVAINPNILLCRDSENIIELYYGPFLEDETREELLSKLIKNGFKEAYSLEMTKEEFDRRCNY